MTVERLRGRAGQAQRQRRLDRTDGLCEHCLAADRITLAVVVNHIIPLIQGGSDDDENTENLCRPCDLTATAKQFNFVKPRQAWGIGRDGRPTSAEHPWNRTKRS
jgi:5-methylcytosine-specific restriction protein A